MISIGDCVKQVSRDRKAQIRTLTEYIEGKYPASHSVGRRPASSASTWSGR